MSTSRRIVTEILLLWASLFEVLALKVGGDYAATEIIFRRLTMMGHSRCRDQARPSGQEPS